MGPKRKTSTNSNLNTYNQGCSESSNTSNTVANPPPNVLPTELLTNQNLQNSPASAAALPRLQQFNFSSTNPNIDTSQSRL